MLEYGAGYGDAGRAFAPHVEHVVGLDISESTVEKGRQELDELGVENVTLLAHPAGEIVDVFLSYAGTIDIVLLYAVIEHLSTDERLAVLEASRKVAGRRLDRVHRVAQPTVLVRRSLELSALHELAP